MAERIQVLLPEVAISLGVSLLLSSLFAASLLHANDETSAAVLPLAACALAAVLWAPSIAAPKSVSALPEWAGLFALAAPPAVVNLGPPIALALLEDGPHLARNEAFCMLLTALFQALPAAPLELPAALVGVLALAILAGKNTGGENQLGAAEVTLLGVGSLTFPLLRRVAQMVAAREAARGRRTLVASTSSGSFFPGLTQPSAQGEEAAAEPQSPSGPKIVLDLAALSSK